MKIKSYFAESVSEAMEKARLELGPDAMLVHSKRVENSLRHLGAYEVVFGLVQGNTSSHKVPRNSPEKSNPDQTDNFLQELAHLRKQVEAVSRSVSRHSYQLRSSVQSSPEVNEIHQILDSSDFAEDIRQDIAGKLESRLRIQNTAPHREGVSSNGAHYHASLFTALRNELEERLVVSPGIGLPGRSIVALIGAPGTGKTSTLVKLAVKVGFTQGIPIQILSTDTMRLGGAEELAAYARVIGAGFRAVHSPSALDTALGEYKDKKLILIDTPGYDAGTISEAAEWVAYLARNPQIEVQLAMPANLRASATARILDRFCVFRPSGLLLTKVDDAETAGSVLDPVLRSGLPVSYLACGQQIPEDIEEATIARLLDKLPHGDLQLARSAA